MKTPNPSSFGVWGVIGKKVEAKNPNGVSAKCAIAEALPKGPAKKRVGDPRGGWVGQSTKKD
jgi:hypothetical protein